MSSNIIVKLYRDGMPLYRQDNSIMERTLKSFNARISHVLCGPTMLGNLHSVMGWPVDNATPKHMQWEDYCASVIWNTNAKDNNFPPGNPSYYPDAMEEIFGTETTKIDWRHPVPDTIKSYLDSAHAVGVCMGKTHFITIHGYNSSGDWLIIDSAPDLNGGKMFDIIPQDEYKYFSKYLVVVKKFKKV